VLTGIGPEEPLSFSLAFVLPRLICEQIISRL
jgi:hypothetical protein